ncbi:hypothetical protein FP2506_16374 [Fulvimarina pelagi HTCC2506]|uniref:Uncharacterized protein n=1 Tax=Fulvimarina pelagi HTCC2506 TaxID=314231 RepID=Q0G0H1_9HYPH|nr:hypothetical protein FP2506_02809 [Fulvimarina pelagi HTCC2506]EAU42026.1 hypothetical protein FP2506_16374 [Fulvimarina pelagi HTCC2506]
MRFAFDGSLVCLFSNIVKKKTDLEGS